MAEIIIALDYSSLEEAGRAVKLLKKEVAFFKVGLELFTRYGPDAVKMVRDSGCEVFLDLKLHDIPNTVAGAVRAAESTGCRSLTVHTAAGKAALRAGAEARTGRLPELWGVTVLSSLGEGSSLEAAGAALEAGLEGVIVSGEGVREVKNRFPSLKIITPGIRPDRQPAEDQKRVLTPSQAVRAGADYLVIGRPVTRSADPLSAVSRIKEEISSL